MRRQEGLGRGGASTEGQMVSKGSWENTKDRMTSMGGGGGGGGGERETGAQGATGDREVIRHQIGHLHLPPSPNTSSPHT